MDDPLRPPHHPIRDTEVVEPLSAEHFAEAHDPPPAVRVRTGEWSAETPPARRALALAGLGAALGVGGAMLLFLRMGGPTAPPGRPAVAELPAVSAPVLPAVVPAPPAAPAPTAAPAAAAPASAPVATPTGVIAAQPQAEVEAAAQATADCRRAYARERYSSILRLCTRAVELESGDAGLHAILAHAELDRGNYARARQWARRALALDPRLAEAYAYLGFVEDQEGRRDEAMAAYRRYLKLAPRGRYAEDIRAIVHAE